MCVEFSDACTQSVTGVLYCPPQLIGQQHEEHTRLPAAHSPPLLAANAKAQCVRALILGSEVTCTLLIHNRRSSLVSVHEAGKERWSDVHRIPADLTAKILQNKPAEQGML